MSATIKTFESAGIRLSKPSNGGAAEASKQTAHNTVSTAPLQTFKPVFIGSLVPRWKGRPDSRVGFSVFANRRDRLSQAI
jgi:hypothetical protein